MSEFIINLNAISKVVALVDFLSEIDADFDIKGTRYLIDAKSIMGVFSLDLSRPVKLVAHTQDAVIIESLLEKLKEIEAIYEIG